MNIYSHDGAPVVAVNDGTILKIGHDGALGKFVVSQDNYGNRFTYAQLGQVAKTYAVPKQTKLSRADFAVVTPRRGNGQPKVETLAKPSAPASAAGQGERAGESADPAGQRRLFAFPDRPNNTSRAALLGQVNMPLADSGNSGRRSAQRSP